MPRYFNVEEAVRRLQALSDADSGSDDDNMEEDVPNPVLLPNLSVSENSDDSSEDDIPNQVQQVVPEALQMPATLVARSGTEWTRITGQRRLQGRVPALNLFRARSGPTPYAIRGIVANSPLSAFRLFLNEPMIRCIQRHTNCHAQTSQPPSAHRVNQSQIEKFIGLQIARGVLCSSNTSIKSLWNKQWGPPIFTNTMSRNDFEATMKHMRFDNRTTRRERLGADRFCAISEIWNPFVENCQKCYTPTSEVTIDEQLFPCKTRCPFTQYIASKPDKFGIKFWLLADAKTKYLFNARPYLGKDPARRQENDVPMDVCMKLMEPLYNQGYNLTTDNFFTSLRLADSLRDKGTSLLGTIRKQRREVPDGDTLMKNRDLHSTEIYSTGIEGSNTTLTIYKAKRKKTLYLLSTMHPTVSINNGHPKKLPETVESYNSSKVGVDVLDQMSRYYTSKSGTRRWPMAVSFNIVDLAAINAWIVFKEVTGTQISRRNFLLQLMTELCQPNEPRVPPALPPPAPAPALPAPARRRQCQIKDEEGHLCRNKSTHECQSCSVTCCGRHIGEKTIVVKCSHCVL